MRFWIICKSEVQEAIIHYRSFTFGSQCTPGQSILNFTVIIFRFKRIFLSIARELIKVPHYTSSQFSFLFTCALRHYSISPTISFLFSLFNLFTFSLSEFPVLYHPAIPPLFLHRLFRLLFHLHSFSDSLSLAILRLFSVISSPSLSRSSVLAFVFSAVFLSRSPDFNPHLAAVSFHWERLVCDYVRRWDEGRTPTSAACTPRRSDHLPEGK